ncbi:hypothetical protein M407DRAFT_107258 [Tulasnella calospora MUT 4182]|uniref:Uncharacterized protein n=1 Tax=Tulasnella calospora MUT 4182 TaxID=1051891 RepID=A0A0C3KQR3_9AGAM|nr:hypothetical protein M407DRAFT_107258 [Tulasnella calospora MUT 4182]
MNLTSCLLTGSRHALRGRGSVRSSKLLAGTQRPVQRTMPISSPNKSSFSTRSILSSVNSPLTSKRRGRGSYLREFEKALNTSKILSHTMPIENGTCSAAAAPRPWTSFKRFSSTVAPLSFFPTLT